MYKDVEARKQMAKKTYLTYYQKKRKLIDEVFGKECHVCHKSENKVICIHKKDGQPHKKLKQMNLADIRYLIENNKDEYVALCALCHTSAHWCMNNLGMNWEDIDKAL